MIPRFFSLILLFSLYSPLCNAQLKINPKDTEVWEPVPEVVIPGINNMPPSDAIVLFDGSNLNEWTSTKGDKPEWEVKDGILTVIPKKGEIATVKPFGDCQLHIEWRSPSVIEGSGQGRGNSGIFFMGNYEIQVLDSYNNTTYSNGQAGSVYKQHIPLVNACRPPGEWQIYDIVFIAPRFDENGKIITPAYISVIHNGVLILNHVEIKGGTTYIGEPEYKAHAEKLPLRLQNHSNPVSFRNIWIREL